jgi:hypothetical protein
MTKLEKELKREIAIDDKAYVVTISPQGLKLTEKGRRKGQELSPLAFFLFQRTRRLSAAATG